MKINEELESSRKKEIEEETPSKVSHKFVTVLSIISILGFIGIVAKTLFNHDIDVYIEVLWMGIIGIGLILEGQIKSLKRLRNQGLTSNNFTHLTTMIVGIITIIAGILSIPLIKITNPAFHAIRGIVSIIAIIVIFVQTWIIEY